VSFGTASYPHDDDTPVTKDVTYRNLGDQPVTLNLAATFNGPDGNPAPAGALTLSASTLTVPAGGTATVQATSDTRHAGLEGFYSGRITATAEGTQVVVPVAVNREGEAYDLKVTVLAPDGKPASEFFDVTLYGLDNRQFESKRDPSGTVTWRLAKGEYLLDAYLEVELPNDDYAGYKLVAPSVRVTSDRSIVLDARKAKVVNTAVPRVGADRLNSDVGYNRNSADGTPGLASALVGFPFGRMYTLNDGPELPPAQYTGHVTSQWGQRAEDGSPANSPFVYGLSDYHPGYFVTGYERTTKPSDFAVVDRTIHATTDRRPQMSVEPMMPGVDGVFVPLVWFDTPHMIRYHLDNAPLGWRSALEETDPDMPFGRWGMRELEGTQYRPGRTYQERWNAATIVPQVAEASRNDDALSLSVRNYTDADGHSGWIRTDSASSTLYRDGEQVASGSDFGFVAAEGLPAGKAAYRPARSATPSPVCA
jgi:hypothetical protein